MADDFEVPLRLETDVVILEPLQHRHNEADLAAWTSSIEHIKQTPGFLERDWPSRVFTPEENAADVAMHMTHFEERRGFTYTVLDARSGEVIGCVYIYPAKTDGFDAEVRSWVRADRAALDRGLHGLVRWWLEEDWGLTKLEYARR